MDMNIQAMTQMKHFKHKHLTSHGPRPGYVTVSNFANLHLPLSAQLIDSSPSALRLSLAQPLKAGNSLAIEWDDICVLGDVVCCTRCGENFQAEIRMDYIIHDLTVSRREARNKRNSN